MDLTKEQKKYMTWGAIAVTLYFFGPGLMRSCRNAQMRTQPMMAAMPARPADAFQQVPPSLNATDPRDASKSLVSPGTFAGRWAGRANIERQGMCSLQMEIRQQPDKTFLGFPAMSCISMEPYFSNPKAFKPEDMLKLMQKPNPATALLSGAFANGAIAFRVDRITGPNPSGCLWSSWVVTPFGSKALTAQWQDSCGGGSMLLDKQP